MKSVILEKACIIERIELHNLKYKESPGAIFVRILRPEFKKWLSFNKIWYVIYKKKSKIFFLKNSDAILYKLIWG